MVQLAAHVLHSLIRLPQNDLPAQLSELPLVALTIHMPTPFMQVLPHSVSEEEKLKFHNALLMGGDILPQCVADAIRTLRFVTLAGPRRTTGDEDRARATSATQDRGMPGPMLLYSDSALNEEEVDPAGFEQELRMTWLQRAGKRDVVRTWRVIHDGDARRLEPMTNGERMRLKKYMENASVEKIERAHGKLFPHSYTGRY